MSASQPGQMIPAHGDGPCEPSPLAPGSGGVTVGDVLSCLRHIAPNELAESWDSNQLICGDPDQPVTKILLAVDPEMSIVDEAIECGADMIVTHHPLFLRGTDRVSATFDKGRRIHRLIRAGIALANAHTSWDSTHGGVADALAQVVGLGVTEVLCPSDTDPSQGIGRVGNLRAAMTLADFAAHVAQVLPDCPAGVLVAGDLEASVERVAVSGGSGDSLLGVARSSGADVFVTADLRHHPASDHLADGRPYLVCPTHWASEWVGLPPLARRLEQELGGHVATVVSRRITDVWSARLGGQVDR